MLALQSSILGIVEELVDGFTYSISLDLGQAVYTQDPFQTWQTARALPGLPYESD